jgi:predicted ATPase
VDFRVTGGGNSRTLARRIDMTAWRNAMRSDGDSPKLRRQAGPRRTGFPRVPALLGREAELAAVRAHLEAGARVVTVVGPPGVGKTSLVTTAVARSRRDHPAWFCDLSGQLTEPDLCRELMALFARAPHGPADVGAWLATLGPLVVVLDNFEQLVGSAATVAEWSDAAPELVLVVTSRERLGIAGEQVLELGPLPHAAAVQLFLDRACEAGVALAGHDAAIREIVESVDRIPLAVELAAARARLLRPADLAARLRVGTDVLTEPRRTPARHRSLEIGRASCRERVS